MDNVTLIDVNEETGLQIRTSWKDDKTEVEITLSHGNGEGRIYVRAADFLFLSRKFSQYAEKAETWRRIMEDRQREETRIHNKGVFVPPELV